MGTLYCNHKYKNGKSAIKDGICEICGEEMNEKFARRIEDKRRRKRKGGESR